MITKEYKIIKYICLRCNTEHDSSDDIISCQLCFKDMCDDDNCESGECAILDCKAKICYDCSKIEKESGEIVCNNCFTKYNMEQMVFPNER